MKAVTGKIETKVPSNLRPLCLIINFTITLRIKYSTTRVKSTKLNYLNFAKTRLVRHKVNGRQSVKVRVYKPDETPKYNF